MLTLFALFALLLAALAVYSTYRARQIGEKFPAIGEMEAVSNDTIMHFVDVPAGNDPDLPPIVFIHGASGNLRDQMIPFRPILGGRARMLFVDRPGHGWSTRGHGNETPAGQADRIAELMDRRGMKRAIISGHSFGGAIAATFALRHPDKTAGLLFLSPATHPWPGGVSWYYTLTDMPVIGPLFAHTLALPAGERRLRSGTACVFAPNEAPDDYVDEAAPALVLRPGTFIANATDIAGLNKYVRAVSPRYPEIKAPTVIITGDSDDVVLADIHSRGLARDIDGAKLIWVNNLGHKPDYAVTGLAVNAIEYLAGKPVDLEQETAKAQAKIAGDDVKCGEPALTPAGE